MILDTAVIKNQKNKKDSMILERRALEDLQRFRKRSGVEIDYKGELAKVREEKYLLANRNCLC